MSKNELVGKPINLFPDKSSLGLMSEFNKYIVESMQKDIKKKYKEKAGEKELLALKIAKEKEVIDVKEFTLLYSYSKEAQKGFRGRVNNPLPTIQKSYGSKILYRKIDVEDWLSNK